MIALSLFSKPKSPPEPSIDFRSRRWFDQYIAYRKQHPLELDVVDPGDFGLEAGDLTRFESVHHPLYSMLLHSGLIYGFPFIYPFRPAPAGQMSPQWITKLTLIDIGLYSMLQYVGRGGGGRASYEEMVDRAVQLMRVYFAGLRRHERGVEEATIEHVMSRHISFRRNWLDWRRTGINCHLFWDWYCFLQFIEALDGGALPTAALFDDLIRRRRSMKLLTMQLIAAAAHSDHEIKLGERVLQHHFEKSSHFFTEKEQARIRRDFREGVDLDSLRLPPAGWMVRRYWLDVSLMTLFADKEIQEAEEVYLQRLLTRLNLTEADLTESKLALGGFLLRFGRRLPFFNSQKASIALITRALSDNMNNLRQAAHGEYRETVEMAATFGRLLQYRLGRGKHRKLPSEEEIAQALDQLKDLPKFLPFFSIIFVPVPGITECYIMLAYTIERLTGDYVRLLPSQFSKMVKRK